MIIPTAASAILVAQQVNAACGGNNCGLTIDYGHQKMEATTASTSCDLAAYAGVPVHKFDINDARQGRNDQDLMFGTLSIPESVEYLYTTFVRDYRGYYSQDQFTYREDPTRAIERSMINFANLALKAVRILARSSPTSIAPARPAPGRTCSTWCRRAGRMTFGSTFASYRRPGIRTGPSRAFTIGIDFGTNSVRAIVVSCADGRIGRHERLRLSRAATRACCSHAERSAPRAAESGGLPRRACGNRSTGALAEAARDAGFCARSRDRHRRRHDRLDAAADRRAGAGRWRSIRNGATTSPRTRGCGRTTPAPTKRRRSRRWRASTRRNYLAPIGGTYSSEWWWSKIWKLPEGGAGRVRRRRQLGRARRLHPGGARRRRPTRRRSSAASAPPVTRRCISRRTWGGLAVEGVPRSARSEARRAARPALRQGACRRARRPGTLCREWAATLGLRRGHRHRHGRLRCALRRRRLGHPAGHAGQDHRHVDLRLRDRAGANASPTSRASAASSTARSCRATSASRPGSRRSATSSSGGSRASARAATRCIARLSREAAALAARRVGPARARLEQRQPHHPRRSAADRPDRRPDAAHDARRDLSRADRSHGLRRPHDHRTALREHGVPIDRVVCCGGIAEKNDLFMQIYADVLGQPMLIAGSPQAPALGAAISAAVTAGTAAGGYDSWTDAQTNA